MAHLNPALTRLRNEVNAAYPRRDKDSDGWIGDRAHQSRASAHNPDPDGSVDAFDMDCELNGPGRPYKAAVAHVISQFEKHPAASYWIYNDQISLRSEGWRARSYAYAGPVRNRHTKHVHLETREGHENSTQPWGIKEGEDVDLDDKVYTAEAKNAFGVPAGERDVRAILAAVDKRTSKLTNTAWLAALVRAETAALRTVVEHLAAALKAGGGNVDTAAVLTGVDERLADLRAGIRSDVDDELDEAFAGAADTD